MCYHTDLFGDVIVLKSDVLLWLDEVAHLRNRTKSTLEQYFKNFDVINKIKLSKLNGLFYSVISKYESSEKYNDCELQVLETVYKKVLDEKKPACPSWFHVCNNFECVVFKQQIKRDKARAKYLKRTILKS